MIDLIRTLTRPIITVFLLCAVTGLTAQQIITGGPLAERGFIALIDAMAIAIGLWFGSRSPNKT